MAVYVYLDSSVFWSCVMITSAIVWHGLYVGSKVGTIKSSPAHTL